MRLPWLSASIVVLGLIFESANASATLLYAGGEDADFVCNGGGTCIVDTTAGRYRSGWARAAYRVISLTVVDPPVNRFATSTFTASSSLWIHAQYCNMVATCVDTTTTSGAQLLRVMDSAGNPTLIVRGTGNPGQLKISSRTSAGVFTDLVTCSSAVNASLTQLDLFVNYGTSGEVALYNNSAEVCRFAGDVTNGDGATTLNGVEFAAARAYSFIGNSAWGYWSEVIIATTDTRGMSRFTANTVGRQYDILLRHQCLLSDLECDSVR